MEDILSKNIYKEKDLLKLSPDYNPTDIYLRMQMRKNMVKDTHSHTELKDCVWSRKTIKRTRANYKVNKEIVKIRNGFRNANIKNRIMLNNTAKYIDNVKHNVSTDNDDSFMDTLKIINDDTDCFLPETSDDVCDLVLCNVKDFKINKKIKPIRIKEDAQKHDKVKNKNYINNLKKDEENVYETNLKDKCSHTFNPLKQTIKMMQTHDQLDCENNIEPVNKDLKHFSNNERLKQRNFNKDENLEERNSKKDFYTQFNDMQTLLIMMAISPQNENEEIDDINTNGNDKLINKTKVEENVQSLNLTLKPIQYTEIENVLNVTQLRKRVLDRQTNLLIKYVMKWRIYIKNKRNMSQQRQITLNSFFDKLKKKKENVNQSEPVTKAKLIARDYNTYQHRYKIQKHIIALQKAKLDEQNRMIEELKYNKIVEASRQSVDAMKEEVRKTYYEIDRQLKPKIKCLTNELKIDGFEEPSLILHCLKVPQFLQRMEKRAREREEKHAMIRERRKQMEEERIRLKQQAELAKAEMDKEEKMKRMKELREKRKREKIENIRKKQYAEKMRALIVMAELHYEKNLMFKYGIRPLRKLIQIKKDNIDKAKTHYIFQIKKNVFLHWMWYTEDMWYERNYKADNCNRRRILKKAFCALKENYHDYILKKQVAEDYYDLYVTLLAFRKLREGVELLKREHEIKWQKVVTYYNSNLLFKTFTCWRTLPALNLLKREQEARKARWREKVLKVVPDYTPPDD